MSWRPRPPDPADRGAGGLPISEVAERLGGLLSGADQPGRSRARVRQVRPPGDAGPDAVAVILDGNASTAASTAAGLVVVGPELELAGRAWLRVADPRKALVELLDLLHPAPPARSGIHPHATVDATAELSDDVHVGPGARIESGARLGARVEVNANTVVGSGCVVGADTVLHPNVTLYPGTRVGERVEIQSGTVIGASGFGLLRGRDGEQRPIPQIGVVVIEDDVVIGANCAIDRATLEETVIGRGTKIDNLVQIGHNCRIGEDCCIVAQTGIAGSVTIGDRCVLLAQSGVKDHLVLGDDVYLGAQSGAARSLQSGEWLGTPALPAPLARRALAGLARLPALLKDVRSLKRAAGAPTEVGPPDPPSKAPRDREDR